jgi:hypothetical protein
MNRRSLARVLAIALPALMLSSTPFSGVAASAKPRKKHAPAAAPAPSTPTTPALSDQPEPETPPATLAAPAPAPVPAAPAPTPPPPPSKSSVELDSLVTEYSAIRDELFRSRAKAAVLGEALFKTKLEVSFKYAASRAWPLKKVSLRLDERPVYSGETANGDTPQKIFETVAAPGRHVLTARIEASGVGEDRVSYTTEDSFGFEIADDKITRVDLTVDETGSGAGPFAKKKEGTFDLRIKANVKSLVVEKK